MSLVVSVIVPCRNEEKHIIKCLDSIIASDYPKNKMEILVIDGMSEDGTRAIINQYTKKYPLIKFLDNPQKIVPIALNIGIKNSSGKIIIRLDAHNIYSQDYISKCVNYLEKYAVDNVGGIWITLPSSDTPMAKAIALALTHPFGVGNAYFRIGSKESRYVDTVPFGCYKREVFHRIGLFDEDLVRNQDDEFNLRLIRNGGKILLSPDIISHYYARDTLGKLWWMYFQYGYFKPLVAIKVGRVLTLRQLAPAFLVGNLIIFAILALLQKPFLWLLFLFLSLYIIINLTFSVSLAVNKGLTNFFFLPIVFATLHFSYGLGYLQGIVDFIILKRHKSKKIVNIPLTR